MLGLKEFRCACCNMKLAEYSISTGQVRIICPRRTCKTMNVIIERPRTESEPENLLINVCAKPENAI